MHVLLFILKLIGIILLILLGILLAILLILLFVPLRYRFEGERTKERMGGSVKVSWLLGLLRICAGYEEGTVAGEVRVLWFKLKSFENSIGRKPGKKNPDKKKETAKEQPDKKKEAAKNQPDKKTEAVQALPDKETETLQTQPDKETEAVQALQDKKPEAVSREDKNRRGKSDRKAGDGPDREAVPGPEEKGEDTGKKDFSPGAFFDRLISVLTGLISILPQKAADAVLGIINLAGEIWWKVSDAADAAGERMEKLEPFTDGTARRFYQFLLKRVIILLRRMSPRKAEGYISYGTGSPDLTAYAGGILYCLFPPWMQKVSIEPDFYNAHLEAKLSGKGHFRLCHAVWMLIRLALRKDTWTMFKRFRRRNK